MKHFKLLSWWWIPFILSGLIQTLSAQSVFEGIRNDFMNSSEVILVSNQWLNGGDQILTQQLYDASDTLLTKKGGSIENSGSFVSSLQLGVATGDFNGDHIEEYVLAHADINGTIMVEIPQIDPETMEISEGLSYSIPGPIYDSYVGWKGVIKVVTGDFDYDREDEFIVAYVVGTEGVDTATLHLDLFDPEGSLEPIFALSIQDIVIETDVGSYFIPEVFDIVADDLDSNGDGEVVVAWDPPGNGHDIFAKILDFSFEQGYTVQSHALRNLDFPQNFHRRLVRLTTGRIHNTIYPSLIAVTFLKKNNAVEETCIRTFSIEDDPNTPPSGFFEKLALVDELSIDLASQTNASFPRSGISTGDLNLDGMEELVVVCDNTVGVFSPDTEEPEQLLLVNKFNMPNMGGSNDVEFLPQFMEIEDNNRDGKDEMFVYRVDTYLSQTYVKRRGLWVFSFNEEDLTEYPEWGCPELIIENAFETGIQKFAIALGDFDGDRARLGEPLYFHEPQMVQPLVVLNAPPIHFDVLDGVAYDVNECFNDYDCEHSATYETSTSTTNIATFETNRDWGVSESLTVGGSFLGIGAEARIESSYGEKFSKMSGASESTDISEQITAIDDDLIYGTVIDYDIWEWPLYVKDSLLGQIIDIKPVSSENRWFYSKSWTGYRYVPDHEVGNILSYQAYPSPDANPNAKDTLKGDFSSANGSFPLNNNSDVYWKLEYSNFTNSSTGTTEEIGLEVGAKVSGWGFNLETNGSYSSDQISTHGIEVKDKFSLLVHLASVDESLSEVSYTVSPYAYWSTNGSVTLDYAARPDLPPDFPPGGSFPDTWWSATYGNEQDPAFILPWRLDEEKGKTLQDPLKKYQTKAIQISPYRPQVGDTVSIYATVHNFSLLPTDDQVKVSFYIGHPNMGGTLLEDVYGNTYVETEDILQPRKRETVEFKWVYPSGLGDYPWLFAFIDPDGEMTEIHEDNNIGFNIIGASNFDPTYTEEVPVDYFSGITLYPNPARVHSVLEFYLQKNARVLVRVYDMNGRLVKTQVDANFAPGDYRTVIDVSQFKNGIYIVTVEADRERKFAKVVVIN